MSLIHDVHESCLLCMTYPSHVLARAIHGHVTRLSYFLRNFHPSTKNFHSGLEEFSKFQYRVATVYYNILGCIRTREVERPLSYNSDIKIRQVCARSSHGRGIDKPRACLLSLFLSLSVDTTFSLSHAPSLLHTRTANTVSISIQLYMSISAHVYAYVYVYEYYDVYFDMYINTRIAEMA